MGTNEAQKRASTKYLKEHGIVAFKVYTTEPERAKYKAQAASKGLSLSAYVIKLLEADAK